MIKLLKKIGQLQDVYISLPMIIVLLLQVRDSPPANLMFQQIFNFFPLEI